MATWWVWDQPRDRSWARGGHDGGEIERMKNHLVEHAEVAGESGAYPVRFGECGQRDVDAPGPRSLRFLGQGPRDAASSWPKAKDSMYFTAWWRPSDASRGTSRASSDPVLQACSKLS